MSLRVVEARSETLAVVRGVLRPPLSSVDRGAMVTVWLDGELGYCASADLSARGLQDAADRAVAWALAARGRGLGLASAPWRAPELGARYRGPDDEPLPAREALIDLLRDEAVAMALDPRIVHSSAVLGATEVVQGLWIDGELVADQRFRFVEPNLEVTACDGGRSQTRTLGGQYNGFSQQGGRAVLGASGLIGGGARIAGQALELLYAPNCPAGARDLLLSPDQMMLQIHESIGHPLELDRILGDERNFAGTSFVTPDMFGSYRYGSELLDVTFDPTRAEEFASYGWDDDGLAAERQYLIRKGVLERPLGGAVSQARAGIAGVANTRSCAWNRPPIDRMANLNIEPGASTLDELVAGIGHGVMMRTNVSWSIDDSRNKFQFGCEWGRMIRGGRLAEVVRNPNYRGISATFWRSLAGVGDAATVEVLGTPFCGKGEPNQAIRVGHASPACRFAGVEVFGGAA